MIDNNHLALVPHMVFEYDFMKFFIIKGYEKHGKQSTKARKFLKWLAKQNNWDLQHCDSPDGEKRYRKVWIIFWNKKWVLFF